MRRDNAVSKGFSLLEILLVIAIVAMIAAYAASSVHRSSQDRAVAKSAVEMQYWLQAASAYYVQNRKWPGSIKELYEGTQPYLPKSQLCSPWHIRTPSAEPLCLGRGEYSGAPSRYQYYWTLQVEVPSEVIAMKLAGQLHSATVKDGTIVTAFAPIPAAISNTENQLLIKSVRAVNVPAKAGTRVSLPTDCPPQWTADYEPAMHTFYQDTAASIIYDVRVMKNEDSDSVTNIPFTYTWTRVMGADTQFGINTVVTFCRPPGYHNGN